MNGNLYIYNVQFTMYNLSVRNDSAAKLYIVNCLIVNELNYHFGTNLFFYDY